MKLYEYEKVHLNAVRKAASECALFLKQDGTFPLEGPCKIAAFGAGVRHTIKGGTGSGEVNSRFSVSIEKGLEQAGFELTTGYWLDAYDTELEEAKVAFVEQIKKEAKAAHQIAIWYSMGKAMPALEYDFPLIDEGEVAIYVLSRDSGEGADRRPVQGDVKLTDTEIRDILALEASFEKFMLVLNVGGPVDLTPVLEVKNILLLSQLGVVGGKVLADILLGKANPSGKLATTWSAWEDYCDLGQFGEKDDTRYLEGIYVGYRYFDSVGKKALFPFGYGVSYTDFTWAVKSISGGKKVEPEVSGDAPVDSPMAAPADGPADQISVTVKVTNVGNMAGKEVVQVYVSAPEGKLDKAYQDLAGFAKTPVLKPGESAEVVISWNMSDLASYDTKTASYILDPGMYAVRVGNSSVNTRVEAVVEITDLVQVLQARNCLGSTDFEDFIPEAEEKLCDALNLQDMDNLPVITLDKSSWETKNVCYAPEYPIDERAEAMTLKELAYMSIGGFNPKASKLSVIGNAGVHCAGAAGETTWLIEEMGVLPMVMADGPAGLRLAKQFYTDKTGAHGVNNSSFPESMEAFMSGPAKLAMRVLGGAKKAPKNAEIKDQYCTAIPIGTAIAQSFNVALAKQLGDLVGEEMERFGVHLWLAPAMNIHRSILCGRNFEYYSEDPLVSGLMAAAITQGVQSHPGCSTTIKHYAANNQETNRYGNNSMVSERAMREIYLKGFGICVRKAQPNALMTSYNLVNGTHTAEHRGLIEEILRCEFGYQGLVMTDWIVTIMTDKNGKYRNTLSDCVAPAGGDLFMPGGKDDHKRLYKAMKDGLVSRKQMEINVSRVLKLADYSYDK